MDTVISVPKQNLIEKMTNQETSVLPAQEIALKSPESKKPKMTQVSSLQVKKLSDRAQLPKRGSEFAAGYDLFR